ncbi:hypothetical protein [Albibacterium indicum]|uniref:hypothetical protein n=1 Tax=Albibacterium indicum TaxID=2292082 RepID=UPI000E471A6A|nr:hypothetical protein [Pedobacter indicus]
MHEIEPFYRWRDDYISSEDERSPFYNQEYSEFEYDKKVYNFLLHPQWDYFGSDTLYLKILYTDYEQGFAIIEMIGEWNDAIDNDIMLLKREVIDLMLADDITKFILIGENILNFHSSDDSYYEEWFQDVDDGWIVGINFRQHVIEEFRQADIDYFINFGGNFDELSWRVLKPIQLFHTVENNMQNRLT